jgi:hypothetical protein
MGRLRVERIISTWLEKPAIEIRPGGEGVLVIDDEPLVVRTAKSMLERYGYTVYQAENGKKASNVSANSAGKSLS